VCACGGEGGGYHPPEGAGEAAVIQEGYMESSRLLIIPHSTPDALIALCACHPQSQPLTALLPSVHITPNIKPKVSVRLYGHPLPTLPRPKTWMASSGK
jgi:hypothetical protein